MGQQTNKTIKKKRRLSYLKRKQAGIKAKFPSKAKAGAA